MHNLNYFGLILWKLYTFELYKDGDGSYIIFNIWNPISWIFLPFVISYPFLMGGIPGLLEEYEDNRFSTKHRRYFILNPDLIKRISR